MKDIKIFFDYKHDHPISVNRALELITDEWIDEGNCCDQTIIDLRDALITVLDRYNSLRKTANELISYEESYGEMSEARLKELKDEIKQYL